MSGFLLKIKTKSGEQVVKNLKPDSTIKDLKTELSSRFNIPEHRLHVLKGFPPKPFDIRQDEASLSTSDIKSGETLILEEKEASAPPPTVTPIAQPHIEISKKTSKDSDSNQVAETDQSDSLSPGILMKKIVPADNSCLFSSVHFVISGKLDDTGTVSPYLRKLIAETISNDPDMYSAAILGKSNDDYCKWIQDEKSWGGAIEVSILANHYGIEFTVVDTTTTCLTRFGEDKCYPHRAFLLFDGIHYDPLYLEPYDGSRIQTIFPADNEAIFNDAEQLAKEANSSRQFTDVQAQEHAQSTGHTNFGEI